MDLFIPTELVLFNPSLAAATADEMGANQVTAAQHNIIVATFAEALDEISNPRLNRYDPATNTHPIMDKFYGPLPPELNVDGKGTLPLNVPVFGALPRPEGEEAAKWWDAICQFIRRMGDTWQVGSGTKAMPGFTGAPVLVAGAAQEAVIPLRSLASNTVIVENPEVARAVRPLLLGTAGYLARAKGLTVNELVEAERSIQPTITQLANEYREDSKMALGVAFGGGALLIAASGFAAYKMKKSA